MVVDTGIIGTPVIGHAVLQVWIPYAMHTELNTDFTDIVDNSSDDDNNDDDNNDNDSKHDGDIERSNVRFLQSPHCTANCLQHACLHSQGAVMWKSHATCHVHITCNLSNGLYCKGTALQLIWHKWNHLWFQFFTLLAETINQWRRGGNQNTPKNSLTMSSRNATYLGLKIQALSETETHTPNMWKCSLGMHITHHPQIWGRKYSLALLQRIPLSTWTFPSMR